LSYLQALPSQLLPRRAALRTGYNVHDNNSRCRLSPSCPRRCRRPPLRPQQQQQQQSSRPSRQKTDTENYHRRRRRRAGCDEGPRRRQRHCYCALHQVRVNTVELRRLIRMKKRTSPRALDLPCGGARTIQTLARHTPYKLKDANRVSYSNPLPTALLGSEALAARVKTLAEEIRADYVDKAPVFLPVMTGAFMFSADLLRAMKPPIKVHVVL